MGTNAKDQTKAANAKTNRVIYVLQRADTERLLYFLVPLSFIMTLWYHSCWQGRGWCQGTGAASKCNCLNQVR